jgi:hypothetical protein
MAAPAKKNAAPKAKPKTPPLPGKVRSKAKASGRRTGRAAPKSAAGIWSWKTPDEAWKLRLALGLIALLLSLVTWWSGEIEHRHGIWKAGFRGLKGELVLGLEWRRGEWPRRWTR